MSRLRLLVLLAVAALVLVLPQAVAPSADAGLDPTVVGQWSEPIDWPVTGIHTAVLSTGETLHYAYPYDGEGSEAWTWNPKSGQFTDVSVLRNFFCGGHAFLPDGTLVAFGGTDPRSSDDEFYGIKDVHTFNPVTRTWAQQQDMDVGRWYPTATTLADGRILLASGLGTDGATTPLLEIYEQGAGTTPVPGDRWLDLYPRMFLLPSGKVLHAGPEDFADELDVETGEWTELATNSAGWRGDGTSVMLPLRPPEYEARVLAIGGADPATDSVEMIDMSAATPEWQTMNSLRYARRHVNSTLLPDGTVLVTGGTGVDNEAADAVFPAELYDPTTGEWTEMASLQQPRLYHSSAVLLPDGRVLTTGGDGEHSGEIYSPPYLFRGDRPVIDSVAEGVEYGQEFTAFTADAGEITKAVLIRPSAVTHSFNQEQRAVEVEFETGNGRLAIEAPADARVAPPGFYMLFLLNADGVPSEAKFVRLGQEPAGSVAGDTNCDGVVKTDDALNMLAVMAGGTTTQASACPAIGSGSPSVFGDLDCDSDVDAGDVVLVMRYAAGLLVEQPPGCEGIGR